MKNNRTQQQPPKYIKVYNSILRNISEGLYAEENKLPSETVLAKQMNVSRMTLRQAIAHLQEDGVIVSKKGVGNFIKKNSMITTEGLEYIGDVMKKCGVDPIDKITCEFRLDSSALYTEKVFERDLSVLLGTTLKYFYQEEYLAETFSIIPADISLLKSKDLSNEDEIIRIVKSQIYEEAKVAQYSLKVVPIEHLKGEHGVLLTEKLFGEEGEVICFNKHYIPIERVELVFNGFKRN